MLSRPVTRFLPALAVGSPYRSESPCDNRPSATRARRRSDSLCRSSPCSPSSRTSCLYPALRLGWLSIFLRIAASETFDTVLPDVSTERWQIFFPEHISVVDFVSGDDIGEGPHAHFLATCGSATIPVLVLQILE